MTEVEICGDMKFNPEVWDYIINKFSRIRNVHYSRVIVEAKRKVSKTDLNMLGCENSIVLNFADDGKYVDLIATDKGQDVKLVLVELNAKNMKKDGWKPIFNSKKDMVFMWVKPPFMVSCIDLSGVPFTKQVKGLIDLFVKTANKMKRFKVAVDFSEAERALGSLMMETKRNEYKNAKERVDIVLGEVSDYNDRLAGALSNLGQVKETLNVARKLKMKKVSVRGILSNVLKIKGVRFVTVEDGEIVVITNSLKSLPFTSDDRKRMIDLGSYRISWGKGKMVKIRNLEKKKGYEYDHPHIKNGVPCWGNMGEITRYAQEFNIEVTVQMILSYLENINPGGVHRNAIGWSNEFRSG